MAYAYASLIFSKYAYTFDFVTTLNMTSFSQCLNDMKIFFINSVKGVCLKGCGLKATFQTTINSNFHYQITQPKWVILVRETF